MSEQSGRLENLEVPGRRLPGMRKDPRDLPGRHRSALEMEGQQDPTPGRVGQGTKHGFVGVQPRPGITFRHVRLPLDRLYSMAFPSGASFSHVAERLIKIYSA
jgi:hypothetical protein